MFAYLSTLTELGCPNCTVLLSGLETQFMVDSLLNFVGIHLFVVFALKRNVLSCLDKIYFSLKTCFALLLPLCCSYPQRDAPSSTCSSSILSTVHSYEEPLLKVCSMSDSAHLDCCTVLFDVIIICVWYVRFN